MWQPEHRRAAERRGLRYPGDMTDDQQPAEIRGRHLSGMHHSFHRIQFSASTPERVGSVTGRFFLE